MIRETKEWLELLEEGIRMWITLKEKCQDGRQDYDKTEYFKDNPGSLLEHAENRCALCEVCQRIKRDEFRKFQDCPNRWGDGCGAFDCAIPEKGIKDRWLDKHTPEAAEFIIQSHKVFMDRLRERGE
jgi:hypothetical protein